MIENLNSNDLVDIAHNDPQGFKEIDIQLKENAYALGLDFQMVMNQVRSAFLDLKLKEYKEEMKI